MSANVCAVAKFNFCHCANRALFCTVLVCNNSLLLTNLIGQYINLQGFHEFVVATCHLLEGLELQLMDYTVFFFFAKQWNALPEELRAVLFLF